MWKEKLLSQGGRKILIKAATHPIPTYAMSCFKFSKSMYNEIESIMAKFWWGQRHNENKIHWLG